ncbi:MAG: WcaF family extracellular polysaccharide biosynthesis acetyltransferase [Chitinophagaceae bacterium]
MKNQVNIATYNNDWYKAEIGASRIRQWLWYFTNVLFFINPLNPISALKIFLLRIFGAIIGNNVVIKQSVNIKYPWKLVIGNNTWIGENVWIDNLAKISIGSNVCISQGAMLLTGNHDFSKPAFNLIVKEISIEDGVWIGARAIVCPGVKCSSHAVLSVMSLANKNLEPYTVYQGNPSAPVRQRVIE